jgi:hypothetical protein
VLRVSIRGQSYCRDVCKRRITLEAGIMFCKHPAVMVRAAGLGARIANCYGLVTDKVRAEFVQTAMSRM